MISQADIIRTLVNQNCTDESILSTALSPDCTPPKLLEKFTEAERFDLALDVSMKLGWDVLPLWKTWAMRCLQNRNFRSARDKFKHCFQRIRSPTGRATLLRDVLKVLTRMDENKLNLSDQIEAIKLRKSFRGSESTDPEQVSKINETKPKIYEECMHYLQEYGNVEQRIKFYVGNHLWDQAIKMLLEYNDLISPSRYFISEVISLSTTTGHLNDVLTTFMKHDKQFEKSLRYFKAVYEYCLDNKRFNTLYYIQTVIGDHVAAAENQLVNFFLRKPTTSYKELNQRLTHLVEAKDNYEHHLTRLISIKKPVALENQFKLFSNLMESETRSRLQIIDTQIEITRNFAINEVMGCINGIEVVVSDDTVMVPNKDDDASPVTLFEKSERRRTFLAALVLIYYDVNCDSYFSDSGILLANKIVSDSSLDKLQVFKTAMRIILEDESSDIVENANLLLKRLQEDYLASTKRVRNRSTQQQRPQVISNDSTVVIAQPIKTKVESKSHPKSAEHSQTVNSKKATYSFVPKDKNVQSGTTKAARLLCDDVIRDTIKICREPDYKMELSKLLSPEARIELNIELGKLSIAQRLAFDMNRPDYVSMILKEAERLSQDHVKDVCQHWLAKH